MLKKIVLSTNLQSFILAILALALSSEDTRVQNWNPAGQLKLLAPFLEIEVLVSSESTKS